MLLAHRILLAPSHKPNLAGCKVPHHVSCRSAPRLAVPNVFPSSYGQPFSQCPGHLEQLQCWSNWRRLSLRPRATASETSAGEPGVVADAILLAWFAAQNSSVFAAQCLVETVIECYRRGMLVDELQQAVQQRGMESVSGELVLEPFQQDVLVSWLLLVMVTLHTIGLTRDKCTGEAPGAVTVSLADMAQGMEAYMGSTLGMYDEGYTLERLLGLQSMVGQGEDQQGSFAYLMKQYARLVITALELCKAQGLATTKLLPNPTAFESPTGYTDAALAAEAAGPAAAGAQQQADEAWVRSRAVQLLVSFMGAVLGSQYATQAFVQQTLALYSAGVPAAQVLGMLRSREFLQGGGLLPVIQQQEVLQEVNKQLFARWLSILYMAAAQAGVVFPADSREPGWAWAGIGDSLEAYALSDFVKGAMDSVAAAQQQEASDAAGAANLDTVESYDPLAERVRGNPEAAAELEKLRRAQQEEMLQQGTVLGREMPLNVKVADPQLGQTSGAVKVMRQQVQLVQLVAQWAEAQRNLPAAGSS